MSPSPDLHRVPGREPDTGERSPERNALVITPRFSRRVIAALQYLSTPAERAPAKVVDRTSRVRR